MKRACNAKRMLAIAIASIIAVVGSVAAGLGTAGATTSTSGAAKTVVVKAIQEQSGGRTVTITETIHPTVVCAWIDTRRVCGSPEYLEYVTEQYTRALGKYYKAYNTEETISGLVEGCVAGIAGVVAVALAPPSEDPLSIGGLKWMAGCGAGAALAFLGGD